MKKENIIFIPTVLYQLICHQIAGVISSHLIYSLVQIPLGRKSDELWTETNLRMFTVGEWWGGVEVFNIPLTKTRTRQASKKKHQL